MATTRVASAAAALILLAGQAAGQESYRYTGPNLGSWHNSFYWEPGGVPGINMNGAYVTVDLQPVSLNNGDRPFITSLSAPSGMWVQAGGLTVSLTASVTGLDIRQTESLLGLFCGSLIISGDSFWRGGLIWSSDARNTGSLTMTSAGALCCGNPRVRGTFKNEGTVLQSHTLTLQEGAFVLNEQAWTINGDIGEFPNNVPNGNFRNSGTLVRSGPTTRDISSNFVNDGQLTSDDGQLRLTGYDIIVRGTITLANNGSLYVSQRYQTGSAPANRLGFSASGLGDLILTTGHHIVLDAVEADLSTSSPHGLWVDGGIIQLDEDLTNLGLMTLHAGRLQGGHAVVNEEGAQLVWGNGVGGAVLAAGLANAGLVTLRGLIPLDGGLVLNAPAGILDISAGGFLNVQGTTNLIHNFGLLRKSVSSTGAGALGAPLRMEGGRIAAERHSLVLNRDSTWGGASRVDIGPSPDARLAFEGGTHVFTGGEAVIQGSQGALELGGSLGPVMILAGGRIHNQLTGAAEFRVTALLECQPQLSFRNSGTLRLTQGGTIDGGPSIGFVNVGLMHLNGGILLGGIDNDGYAVLDGAVDVGVVGGADGSLVNSEGATFEMVQGSVRVRAVTSSFENRGTTVKNTTSQAFISGAGVFRNPGSLQVRAGNLAISASIPQLQNGLLTGGAWIVFPGATLTLPMNVTRIAEGTHVSGGSQSMPSLPTLNRVEGDLRVRETLTLQGALLLLTPGAPAAEGARLTIDPGWLTVPNGVENGNLEDPLSEIEEVFVPARSGEPRLVTPLLTSHARLVPGGHDRPGPFNLTGNLLLRPGGRLLVELGGLLPVAEHDRFVITGSATLAGTLDLTLIDGFVPQIGQQFTVLTTSGGVSGVFSAVLPPPDMPPGLGFSVLYTANAVTLQVGPGCYPNCDSSTTAPLLNVADFGCFLSRYAAGHAYANCDASTQPPVLNVADFGCFLQRYAAGCP
ncbi:MAG: hypothetical protein WD749_10400 [Phycisphaerales bacterium]